MPVDLQNALIALRRDLLGLGALVEQQVQNAVTALMDADADLARRVLEQESTVDRLDLEIESACMRLLALGNPVASDLRFVLSVLRISGELERIADLAKGIAKRTIKLGALKTLELPVSLGRMADAVRAMLSDALGALANNDVQLSGEVRRADEFVDDLNKEILSWGRSEIPRDVDNTSAAIHVLTISQRLERMADIVTSIAGDVIFLVEGRVVRHTKED